MHSPMHGERSKIKNIQSIFLCKENKISEIDVRISKTYNLWILKVSKSQSNWLFMKWNLVVYIFSGSADARRANESKISLIHFIFLCKERYIFLNCSPYFEDLQPLNLENENFKQNCQLYEAKFYGLYFLYALLAHRCTGSRGKSPKMKHEFDNDVVNAVTSHIYRQFVKISN